MWSPVLVVLAGIANLGLVLGAATTSTNSIPKSTQASSYLSDVWAGQGPTPTWATGKYATTLASALYSIETSFGGRSDYTSIVDAIYSAASKGGGANVVSSLSVSQWNWGDITTNGWYTSNVPKSMQTEISKYDSAWESAITKVEAKATATGNAAAPRCTGMEMVGVAAGVAGVAAVAGLL
ncbi:hypothetical protein M406DRAFT_358649 [Cryphonectria parasitica EP155]|uniref:Uncharacterized protein n=1 Tax=Cryphonectria parasitica (strain ATCC 38755 / EP155) TaxID=660469 RepID=A0A9P5CJ48_CRYP1|nr:uncharacterized protein M406DRAFT_358649 [Cryphonectria parasitica EP155]KAF3759917.1 hypothetical protein M406DRAFT_358649 [Cryphonectria parasitica EP155]